MPIPILSHPLPIPFHPIQILSKFQLIIPSHPLPSQFIQNLSHPNPNSLYSIPSKSHRIISKTYPVSSHTIYINTLSIPSVHPISIPSHKKHTSNLHVCIKYQTKQTDSRINANAVVFLICC